MKLFYVCTPTLMVLPEIKRLWIPNTSEMAFMEPLKTVSPLNYVYPRVTLRSGSQAEDGDWMMEPCFSFLFDPSTHYIGILGLFYVNGVKNAQCECRLELSRDCL